MNALPHPEAICWIRVFVAEDTHKIDFGTVLNDTSKKMEALIGMK